MTGRDWTVPPGWTLRDWREEHNLSARVVARMCRMDVAEIEKLEAGKRRLTKDIAWRLQRATGIPAAFWLRFERMYREDLKAGLRVFDA